MAAVFGLPVMRAPRRSQRCSSTVNILAMVAIGICIVASAEFGREKTLGSTVADVSMGAIDTSMTRASGIGKLKISSTTDPRRLRGAVMARLNDGEEVDMDAAGIRAISSALKSLAIINTRKPSEVQGCDGSVEFRRIKISNATHNSNLTIVNFKVNPSMLDDIGHGEEIRVSRTTHVGKLGGTIFRLLEGDPSKRLLMRVMGAEATTRAIKGLCVARFMLEEQGINNRILFSPKFVRDGELSVVEMTIGMSAS